MWKLNLAGYEVIEATATHLQLSPSVVVDLRERADLAHRLLDQPEEVAGSAFSESSLSSDLLPEWDEEWLQEERETFHHLRAAALEALCEFLTTARASERAVRAGLAAVAAEPFSESARLALIKAYLAGGNTGLAVQHYRAFCRFLRDELELDPSRELDDLIRGSSSR